MKTVLIGFGDIAEKHVPVLRELGCEITGLITKNYEKALEKAKKFEIPCVYKSIEEIPSNACDFFMVLTSADMIAPTLKKVIPLKKPILTEKPVGLSTNEIQEVLDIHGNFKTPVMVGVNRRFYSIFHQALRFLKDKDKPLEAIKIEAPERLSNINNPKFNDVIRKNWMFANSIHCVDLIRFFCGDVKELQVNSNPTKFLFSSLGTSINDINFTYVSNWKSTGYWTVTMYADDVKIVFSPLEKGKIIEKNKETEILPSVEDIKFKPGFYFQLSHFLKNLQSAHEWAWPASDLNDHKKTLNLIEQIYKIG
jgi:predicted dehydrogenase